MCASFVDSYRGYLLPASIADELDAQLYIPTAVAVPVLDYVSESGPVQMVLVGDPSCPAVQINDGLDARAGGWQLCRCWLLPCSAAAEAH